MHAGVSPPLARDGLHRAGWVVKDPQTVIPNGYVVVKSGRVRETGVWGKQALPAHLPVRDHGPGALIPTLVNTHTHLELSCFRERISCQEGFRPWVQQLLKLREETAVPEMLTGAEKGLVEIRATGTGAICDISSLGITSEAVAASGLQGVWCREFLGDLAPAVPAEPEKLPGRATGSLAGHAPHTTSPALLKHLKRVTEKGKLPFSIHLSESSTEIEFIRNGRGDWAEFLSSRGIDFSDWGLPARSPVAHLDRLGILDERTIAVHVLQADDADLDLLRRRRTSVCLCPRSNQALHGRLPDIPAMLARGLHLSLGTDSLASTPSLDLFDEMAFIAAHFDDVDPVQIFRMATLSGARALLMAAIGTLERDAEAQLLYVPVSGSNEHTVIEAIVNKDFDDPVSPV